LSFVENFLKSSVQCLTKKGKERERGQRLKYQRFYILFKL
jgi:hypothetical protein